MCTPNSGQRDVQAERWPKSMRARCARPRRGRPRARASSSSSEGRCRLLKVANRPKADHLIRRRTSLHSPFLRPHVAHSCRAALYRGRSAMPAMSGLTGAMRAATASAQQSPLVRLRPSWRRPETGRFSRGPRPRSASVSSARPRSVLPCGPVALRPRLVSRDASISRCT